MKRKQKKAESSGQWLFDPATLPIATEPQKVGPLLQPVWTENKARFIERYLYYFVLVTKHGTYIDGFAGPQRPSKPEAWAAKLVLDSKPSLLRHFHLFDTDKKKFRYLEDLKRQHPDRDVQIYREDFNAGVGELLSRASITDSEATFCLLDQQTFECHWATVQTLAQHKQSGYKIELFYFLPNFWLGRALAAQKRVAAIQKWWGRGDWDRLSDLTAQARGDLLVKRFKEELGYRFVFAFPIFQRKSGGRIMFYMIHASDHPAAPDLMRRAYNKAVQPKEPPEQLELYLQKAFEGS